MSRLSAVALLASLVVLAVGASSASAAVKVRKGVEYGQASIAAGDFDLLLDLHEPSKRSKALRPVVVLLHGGGFVGGSRSDPNIGRVAKALAARGIVVASIDYRLNGQGPVASARVAALASGLPDGGISPGIVAAVDDTLTATDYLKKNARKLHIDPKRLGLAGSSAGAITADHVAYVVDDYGIKQPQVAFVGSLWGGILIQPRRGGVGADQLERGEASLFMSHGDADRTVPVALSEQLFDRAKSQRVDLEYHRIPGGTHGYPGSKFFTYDAGRGQTPFDRFLSFAKRELR